MEFRYERRTPETVGAPAFVSLCGDECVDVLIDDEASLRVMSPEWFLPRSVCCCLISSASIRLCCAE